jgi:hypothetical protein
MNLASLLSIALPTDTNWPLIRSEITSIDTDVLSAAAVKNLSRAHYGFAESSPIDTKANISITG